MAKDFSDPPKLMDFVRVQRYRDKKRKDAHKTNKKISDRIRYLTKLLKTTNDASKKKK
jgi:hypothetical protein